MVGNFRAHLHCAASIASMISLILTIGCKAQSEGGVSIKRSSDRISEGTEVSLTLTGYNYTNRYIDEFSVNGNGGGNLFVSSTSSGGGGSVCCVRRIKGAIRPVKIRWQSDACIYHTRLEGRNETFEHIHSYFSEVVVPVASDDPDHPRYFEVHFFPDGHVEAAVTEAPSSPRIELPKEREDKTNFRRCPNDKKPDQ